ncbi:type II toxin-antitoxin system VapC family toxin [Pseudanabaenaceae cyanobacterium LEGE 13415]|nr:type II toxin-antitoxin system VapC family toxin [Pseudanabaenaceae cyanobacterium LEGE 13415]
MHLLDTNIVSALYAGNERVIRRLQNLDDPQVGITIITKVELLRGRIDYLLKATDGESLLRAQTLLARTEQLLDELEIIPFEQTAIAQFERLKAQKSLRKFGRSDLLIASIALANRATLVTRNLKDFQQIANLKLVNWLDR